MRVNMAKKNVRQNISRLYEKLALEIIEDFETISSQARLYRVYSYKQILERRRAVGLEYVLRNKGVVFCSADGTVLVTSPTDSKKFSVCHPTFRANPCSSRSRLHMAANSVYFFTIRWLFMTSYGGGNHHPVRLHDL